jgi:hypothetical protein
VRKFHRVSAALGVQCVEELSEIWMMLLVFRSNVQPSHSRGNLSGEQVCLLSAGLFARASSCPGGVFTRSRLHVWPSSCRWAAKVSTCSTGDGRNARSSGRCRRLARRFVWGRMGQHAQGQTPSCMKSRQQTTRVHKTNPMTRWTTLAPVQRVIRCVEPLHESLAEVRQPAGRTSGGLLSRT